MAELLNLHIVSAEAEIFSGQVEMLIASAEMGDVGIAHGHAAFISRIKPGEIHVKISGEEDQLFYISGGLLEVQPHAATVLADTAVRAADIDEAAAIQAQQRAEELLHDKQAGIDYAKAQLELAQAMAQLQALRHYKKK